jgi:hypothetical protein
MLLLLLAIEVAAESISTRGMRDVGSVAVVAIGNSVEGVDAGVVSTVKLLVMVKVDDGEVNGIDEVADDSSVAGVATGTAASLGEGVIGIVALVVMVAGSTVVAEYETVE